MTKANGKERDGVTTQARRGAVVEVSLDGDLAVALAAYRRAASAAPSLEGDIRHILRLWLAEHGYLERSDDEGLKPDALNASNDG